MAKSALFDQSTASACDLEENGFFSSVFPVPGGQGLGHPPLREKSSISEELGSHILLWSWSYSDALSAHPQPLPAPPAGTMNASGLTQPHLAAVLQPDLPGLDTTTLILERLLCRGSFVTPKPGGNTPLLLVSPICVSRAALSPLGRALKAP